MTEVAIVYRAREGYRITDKDAAVVGPAIERLAERLGDRATPADVVAAALPADSPIHKYFEWRDDVAAGHWRLWQARSLMASYEVKIGTTWIRGMHNVVESDTGGDGVPDRQSYVPVRMVLADEDLTEQVIAGYEKRLRTMAREIRLLKQAAVARFQPVLDAIDRLSEAVPV